MGYADAGPSACNLTELARWKQCLAATDATSFWSGRDEARAVVKEFDLDPMTDGYGDALWRKRGSVYAPNGGLRDVIIRLWNMGAAIHGIEDMEDKDTCWGYYETGEPKGFSVEFAFRRRLPVSSKT